MEGLMSHSSTFLLPPDNNSSSSSSSVSLKYALVILNQNLPKFTPLLWDH
ncbi:thiamine pyrophosphokinase 1-like, partial [Trifolium medium]|nr:thiamine pyrophosphokinase 1-like [Trifolium medium]